MNLKIKKSIYYLISLLFFVLIIEGFTSFMFMLVDSFAKPQLAERVHTAYHPVRGWAHIPGITIKDMYGKDKNLIVNSQGFRSKTDIRHDVEKNKVRILFLGDSFTLGFGVAQDETFCSLIPQKDASLETVNAGQGGYGIDQMYLWYKEIMDTFKYDIVVLSYIDLDILRMNCKAFLGYGKPYIKLENGILKTHNVPVPHYGYGLFRKLSDFFEGLSIHRLLNNLSETFLAHKNNKIYKNDDELIETYLQIVYELNNLVSQRGAKLVVVRLPTTDNISKYFPYEEIIFNKLSKQDIIILDIVPGFKKLGPEVLASMFLNDRNVNDGILKKYLKTKGHYSPFGHRIIADTIYNNLKIIIKNTN